MPRLAQEISSDRVRTSVLHVQNWAIGHSGVWGADCSGLFGAEGYTFAVSLRNGRNELSYMRNIPFTCELPIGKLEFGATENGRLGCRTPFNYIGATEEFCLIINIGHTIMQNDGEK